MGHRKRRNYLELHIAPGHIFAAGIASIALFLFQQSLAVRVAEVLIFAVLAVLSGKRIRWGYFAIMVSTIAFFNLLTPLGAVLVRIGPFAVTRGALRQGVMKGLAIPGLVFISLFAVRKQLSLPGKFGGLLARLFFYFEQLLDGRKKIQFATLVDSIDQLLLGLMEHSTGATGDTVHDPEGPADQDAPRRATTPLGYVIVGLLVAGLAAPVVVGFV